MLVVVNEESGGQLNDLRGASLRYSLETPGDWSSCSIFEFDWLEILLSFHALVVRVTGLLFYSPALFPLGFCTICVFLMGLQPRIRFEIDVWPSVQIIYIYIYFLIQIIYDLFLINKSIHKLILTSAFNWNKVDKWGFRCIISKNILFCYLFFWLT